MKQQANVEEKRVKLKEATEKDDYETMTTLVEELQQELYSLGASVSQQANAASQAAEDPNSDNKEDGDEVIDADFTETK
jgi:molecular chaperone DnaK